MEERSCRADFGILGAKYVPRALARSGHIETAFQTITQPAFPGWVNWIHRGATTLREHCDGRASRNHIIFGDIAAWMMEFLAGFTPDETKPGFSEITLQPYPVHGLDTVEAFYRVPAGEVAINWKRRMKNLKSELQHLPAYTGKSSCPMELKKTLVIVKVGSPVRSLKKSEGQSLGRSYNLDIDSPSPL